MMLFMAVFLLVLGYFQNKEAMHSDLAEQTTQVPLVDIGMFIRMYYAALAHIS